MQTVQIQIRLLLKDVCFGSALFASGPTLFAIPLNILWNKYTVKPVLMAICIKQSPLLKATLSDPTEFKEAEIYLY